MTDTHVHIPDYLAGNLSRPERDAAERHLAGCSDCRDQLEAARDRAAGRGESLLAASASKMAINMLRGGMSLIVPALRSLAPEEVDLALDEAPKARREPLRVLEPRAAVGALRALGFLGRFGIVLLLTSLVLLLPRPAGLSDAGHRALAVFVFTGSILALEPVSLPIAALMIPVAQVALGTATATQAFETFSRPVVFLILASLFLAEALRKHGLTRRLALATIVSSGGGIGALLFGLMGIAALLSMWVENTATAAVLIPVALTISKQVPEREKASRLLVLLVFGIAYGASLGGMATVMGSASNAVASGFLSAIRPWSFVDWMKYGLPAFLIVFPITWYLLLRIAPTGVDSLDVKPVQEESAKLGGMSPQERIILWTMVIAAFFWITGGFLEPMLGLPPTLLSAAIVAVVAVAFLAIRNIINWEDIKGVSWGIFLIIGAGLSLGEALSRTGATDWFADLITPLVSGPPLLVSLLILVYLSALLTNLMNNTTIAAVFVPILISVARSDPSLNPVQLVLPVTLATTFGYSLPSASGRMALIAATGIVDRNQMIRYGLIMTVVSSAVLALFFFGLIALGIL